MVGRNFGNREIEDMELNVNEILAGLDEAQRQAAGCIDGPVLIVAGAGAGKTRVLTSRIAYALARGVEPDRVLALTFTKKAASEMKERIASMVGPRKAVRLYMGTFHAIFVRFLRDYAEQLGYPQGFTIYDTSDSISAIKRCLKDLGLDDKTYKPKSVLGRISMAKNNLVSPEDYRKNANAIQNDIRAKVPRLCDVYKAYQNVLKQSGVMDFDDILFNMNVLLQTFPDACEAISSRFDYILVDEYQDTNYAQNRILMMLAKKHRNICVVGDDSQSIYAFRGARIENILNFKKAYPECRLFRLEQNYRSTQNIVNAANSLISKNSERIPKECYSKGDKGAKIHLIEGYTEQEEALLVASSIIRKMQSEHAQYQDFAILYRTNSQSRALEEALRKRNLPYVIYSGNSFFERAEVKDMMAYFKLVVNPTDDESFRRAVNKPARGIGDTSVEALAAAARAHGVSMMKAIYLEDVAVHGLKPAAVNKLMAFANMIMKAHMKLATVDAWTLAKSICDASGLYAFYKTDNTIESQTKASNIEELVNSVKVYVDDTMNSAKEDLLAENPDYHDISEIADEDVPMSTLGDYLENISLLSTVDREDDEETSNKITLMTVHASKGLEYPYVYVTGMEENLFPSGGSLASINEIEEERRLFYVALTRAKVSVDISFASTRLRNGKSESNAPSRFVREIAAQYIDNPLTDRTFSANDDEEPYPSRGFLGSGGRFSGAFSGRSSAQSASFRKPNSSPRPSAPSRPSPASLHPNPSPSRPNPAFRQAADEDFVPVSVLELREGQRVEHNRFGLGTIKSLTGSPADRKAVIDFDKYGEKILVLKYAKLRFPK